MKVVSFKVDDWKYYKLKETGRTFKEQFTPYIDDILDADQNHNKPPYTVAKSKGIRNISSDECSSTRDAKLTAARVFVDNLPEGDEE